MHPVKKGEITFAKTDLAKFEFLATGQPHWVSRGAQKNFAEFHVRVAVLNGFTALGIPVTEAMG